MRQQIDSANFDLGAFDSDAGRFLLHEIADVFQTIVRTVQDNCERIATEVAEYRTVEDAGRLRSRLNRLIHLHDEYLEPVVRLVDINGDFYATTEQITNCCARLAVFGEGGADSIGEEARFIQKEIVWLRRAVVHRAEEARRELAPLCEAAARESKISIGVNRALDAISQRKWSVLSLERNLTIVDERDATLFSDAAVERFIRLAMNAKSRTPPRILSQPPEPLAIPVTAEDLIERLELMETLDDLLEWVLESCDDASLDLSVRLFHSILELRPHRTQHDTARRDYARGDFIVNATRWDWKGESDGDNDDDAPRDGRPARKTRRRVPVPPRRKAHLP